MTDSITTVDAGFSSLALAPSVQQALVDAGYTEPTPIQSATIPYLLDGRDLIGQAQTGTGKTAAFALPLLSKIDPGNKDVQILVLAPTRELANQVADGFSKYSRHMRGLNVLPVYGGQDYGVQLNGLRRGAQVVVGTPGRVMDHIRRGTLRLDKLTHLVLDEADEMLRMGFIDDVEWVLEQTPDTRQIALFSATMPNPIRRIAQKHLTNPKEIIIEGRTAAADSISQRYLVVPGAQKANALCRILEIEEFDGVMVFVKTKTSTVEVAERLVAAGHAACALNGDLSQNLREQTVNKLKSGRLNIVVATDVAARGLDVERISHVFNFDAPHDAETYVHRVGRTGRAGRSGEAILFLSPNEQRVLRNITRATKQELVAMQLPTVKNINEVRMERFRAQITDTLQNSDTSFFRKVIDDYVAEHGVDVIDAAAAIAHMLQGKRPLLLKEEPQQSSRASRGSTGFGRDRDSGRRRTRTSRERSERYERSERNPRRRSETRDAAPSAGMQQFRLEVGATHDVQAKNIVGAIANEAGIDSQYIGRVQIFDSHSTVELPQETPRKIWRPLKNVQVCGEPLKITKLEGAATGDKPRERSDDSGFDSRTRTNGKARSNGRQGGRFGGGEKRNSSQKRKFGKNSKKRSAA